MKKRTLLTSVFLSLCAFAQTGNNYNVPATGIGLSIVLGPGSCVSTTGSVVTYPGGVLNLTANTTNYAYLDNTCTVRQNTTGFATGGIPIFSAVTGVSQVNTITDQRGQFFFTASGAPTLPVYLNSGTPLSQSNECNSITTDTSGNAVTAVAALRAIGTGGAAHDVMCVVTVDASNPNAIGSTVWPFTNISSGQNASTPANGGLLASGTANVRAILTNTSGTKRTNGIQWRSCVGGCGLDLNMQEDAAQVGNEDMSWISGTGITGLYMTFNCPGGCATTFSGSAAKQVLLDDGTHDAKTNPEFGIVNGHLGHGTTGSNATDTWGTATCAGSTATVTFAGAFSNATYQVLLTDQTTAGGARVSTKNVGSFVITCTGATDSVDYLVLGNPF